MISAARSHGIGMTTRLLGVGFLALVIVAWEVAARMSGAKAAMFPPPSAVAATLATMLADGRIARPLVESLVRLAAGYAAALVLAVGLGVTMGYSRIAHNLFEPLVELIRPIPKPALVAPLIFFLGLGDAMKVTVVALGVFFPILVNTIQGVRGIERGYVEAARTFGFGTVTILGKVMLPAALPQIFAGMHISLGIGFVLVIIAELISADGGLGFAIVNAQRSFRVKEMYAWVVVLAVTGYAMNELFLLLRARLLAWHRDYDSLERTAAQA
jgi:ABC-type nitrate/sulfonate/bicarbonate transport system permease component